MLIHSIFFYNFTARRYPCLEVNTKHDRKRDLQDQEKLAEIVDRLFPTYCVNGPMRSGKSFLTITQKRWINPTTNASTIVVNNAFYPEVGVNEVELNRNVLTTNKLSSNPGRNLIYLIFVSTSPTTTN